MPRCRAGPDGTRRGMVRAAPRGSKPRRPAAPRAARGRSRSVRFRWPTGREEATGSRRPARAAHLRQPRPRSANRAPWAADRQARILRVAPRQPTAVGRGGEPGQAIGGSRASGAHRNARSRTGGAGSPDIGRRLRAAGGGAQSGAARQRRRAPADGAAVHWSSAWNALPNRPGRAALAAPGRTLRQPPAPATGKPDPSGRGGDGAVPVPDRRGPLAIRLWPARMRVRCGGCSSVVEHWIVAPGVAGSIPVFHPTVRGAGHRRHDRRPAPRCVAGAEPAPRSCTRRRESSQSRLCASRRAVSSMVEQLTLNQ